MMVPRADDIVIDAKSGRVADAKSRRTGYGMIASRSPFWLKRLEAATMSH